VFRRLRSSVASLALVAFVATLIAPALPSEHTTDVEATAGERGFAHPRTQVEQIHPPVAGEHCALCHWMRTLGHTVPVALATPVAPSITRTFSPVVRFGLIGFDSSDQPARAPPASV
jgi:hypothetical protein